MEPKNLGGVPRQPKAEEEEFEQKLDPEKFKKILKVDDSDSAQKRNKRNLNRSQEEGDDTEDVTPQAPPTTEFKALMGDQVTDEGIFGKQEVQSSQTGSTLKQVTPDFEVGDSSADEGDFDENDQVAQQAQQYAPLASPPQTPSSLPPEEEAAPPPEEEWGGEEIISAPSPSSEQQPTNSSNPKKSEEETPPKKAKVTTPHTVSVPKTPEATKKPTVPPKAAPARAEKGLPAGAKPKIENPEAMEEAPATHEELPEVSAKEPVSPAMITEPSKTSPVNQPQTVPQVPVKETERDSSTQEQPIAVPLSDLPIQVINREPDSVPKEKKHEMAPVSSIPSTDTIISSPSPLPLEAPTPVSPTTMAPFSQLSPQTFALFEKMVGLITVQTSMQVSTTTVTVAMPGSIFDKSEIVLQQFSTARNAFTVEIRTTPEAMKAINDEFTSLVAAMESAKLNVQINLQRPTLLSEYQAMSKKAPRPVTAVKGKNRDKKDHEE